MGGAGAAGRRDTAGAGGPFSIATAPLARYNPPAKQPHGGFGAVTRACGGRGSRRRRSGGDQERYTARARCRVRLRPGQAMGVASCEDRSGAACRADYVVSRTGAAPVLLSVRLYDAPCRQNLSLLHRKWSASRAGPLGGVVCVRVLTLTWPCFSFVGAYVTLRRALVYINTYERTSLCRRRQRALLAQVSWLACAGRRQHGGRSIVVRSSGCRLHGGPLPSPRRQQHGLPSAAWRGAAA